MAGSESKGWILLDSCDILSNCDLLEESNSGNFSDVLFSDSTIVCGSFVFIVCGSFVLLSSCFILSRLSGEIGLRENNLFEEMC